MASWKAVLALPPEPQNGVCKIYGTHFPIAVRHYLSEWIESFNWDAIDLNNEAYATEFFQLLFHEIDAKVLQQNQNPLIKSLSVEAAQWKLDYSNNPLQIIRIIRCCLQAEKKLLKETQNSGSQRHYLLPKFEMLIKMTQETKEAIRQMRQEQEQIQMQMKTQQPVKPTAMELIITLPKEINDNNLNLRIQSLQIVRKDFQDRFHETLQLIDATYNKIIRGELMNWKIGQKLAGNGFHFNDNLDQIQKLCELLMEIVRQNWQQGKQQNELENQFSVAIIGVNLLPILTFQFRDFMSSLIKDTFVVETQPLQVIRTNTKFSAKARLLVGSKLSVQMTRPKVIAQLINEVQASAIIMNQAPINKEGYFDVSSGEILNNVGTLENDEAKQQLSINFTNLELKKVNRTQKKGAESVTDEKFCLLFQSFITIVDGEPDVHVWTMSLPVVIIVHGSQEPNAWATVTWDNAFSGMGRSSFAVPEFVPWPRVAQTLSLKFQSIVGTGLHEQNLQYLASKVFNASPNLDFSNMSLSWSQFCKVRLPNREFTFWEWFYAAMKLTHDHLKNPWKEGLILGFVDRFEAEHILRSQSGIEGTFLLRFTESQLGCVSVACLLRDNHTTRNTKAEMIEPMAARDLDIKSLAVRLNELKQLSRLCPNIPKDVAFPIRSGSLNANTTRNGYRKIEYIGEISGSATCQEVCPNIPQPLPAFDPQLGNANLMVQYGGLNMPIVGVNAPANNNINEVDSILPPNPSQF